MTSTLELPDDFFEEAIKEFGKSDFRDFDAFIHARFMKVWNEKPRREGAALIKICEITVPMLLDVIRNQFKGDARFRKVHQKYANVRDLLYHLNKYNEQEVWMLELRKAVQLRSGSDLNTKLVDIAD
jgi:hypothetical protein